MRASWQRRALYGLALATAIGVCCAQWIISSRRQHAAFDFYRRQGMLWAFQDHGYERYQASFGWGGLPYYGKMPARESPLRNWLADRLGDDFVYDITKLDVGHGCFSQEDAARLADFPKLRYLDLRCTTLFDDDLAVVGRLSQLEFLSLTRAQHITDAGIAHLAGLRHLRAVRIFHARLSDAGLTPLLALPRLECLELTDTPLTDAGLTRLAGCEHLSVLAFDRRSTTDLGIQRLQERRPGLQIVQFMPYQDFD